MKKINFQSNLVIVLLCSLAFFISSPSARAQSFFMENPLVGQTAPDFTLKTFNGEKTNMTKFRDNKSAIFFFWATWCPHCREALKGLNQKRSDMENKGIKLMLVDVGEGEKEVRRYVERNKIGATIFLDQESSLADPYGIIGVPTFVFVDSKGVVRAVDHMLPDNYEEILAVKDRVRK